jgi:hypothetical protein
VHRQESEVYSGAKELFLSTFFDHLTRLKDKASTHTCTFTFGAALGREKEGAHVPEAVLVWEC